MSLGVFGVISRFYLLISPLWDDCGSWTDVPPLWIY